MILYHLRQTTLFEVGLRSICLLSFLLETKRTFRKLAVHTQQIAAHFWNRFLREYLPIFQSCKWGRRCQGQVDFSSISGRKAGKTKRQSIQTLTEVVEFSKIFFIATKQAKQKESIQFYFNSTQSELSWAHSPSQNNSLKNIKPRCENGTIAKGVLISASVYVQLNKFCSYSQITDGV